jgi:hypothetical protein
MNRVPEPSPPSATPAFPELAHGRELGWACIVYVERAAVVVVGPPGWGSWVLRLPGDVSTVEHVLLGEAPPRASNAALRIGGKQPVRPWSQPPL